MRRGIRSLLIAFGISAATLAGAAEFKAVGDLPAVLYDSPSQRGQKLFVLSRHYPLEVLVKLELWTKVRDQAGDVGWVENKSLGPKRVAVVSAPSAEVRTNPDAAAPIVFEAQKQVLLDLVDPPASSPLPTAWVKVAHRDGQSGWVRASQIWGI